jgi:hypothetical protein
VVAPQELGPRRETGGDHCVVGQRVAGGRVTRVVLQRGRQVGEKVGALGAVLIVSMRSRFPTVLIASC